jgi:hypothetical protein
MALSYEFFEFFSAPCIGFLARGPIARLGRTAYNLVQLRLLRKSLDELPCASHGLLELPVSHESFDLFAIARVLLFPRRVFAGGAGAP